MAYDPAFAEETLRSLRNRAPAPERGVLTTQLSTVLRDVVSAAGIIEHWIEKVPGERRSPLLDIAVAEAFADMLGDGRIKITDELRCAAVEIPPRRNRRRPIVALDSTTHWQEAALQVDSLWSKTRPGFDLDFARASTDDTRESDLALLFRMLKVLGEEAVCSFAGFDRGKFTFRKVGDRFEIVPNNGGAIARFDLKTNGCVTFSEAQILRRELIRRGDAHGILATLRTRIEVDAHVYTQIGYPTIEVRTADDVLQNWEFRLYRNASWRH